jgi:RNA polymerase sigma factor (sigma-70 family)
VALLFRATPLRRPVQRERLVAEHWYLCRRAAGRFMRRGLERADLEQVGAIGLIKAADRYDAAERAPFAAYAWILVIGELMHYVRDNERLVRAPRGVRNLERRWACAERDLRPLLGREPTEDEVTEFLAVSPAQAREIRAYRASRYMAPLELLRGRERCVPFGAIDDLLDRLYVERILEALPPLQRKIVVGIHLERVSIVELAARLGYSRRHVTRLHRTALARLRCYVE